MRVWWILWWSFGAFAVYLAACLVLGFLGALAKGLGIRRKPRFKVVRYEETE
jgi:hypothetical protein